MALGVDALPPRGTLPVNASSTGTLEFKQKLQDKISKNGGRDEVCAMRSTPSICRWARCRH